MNTKVNEGKLISGKEALIALANGQEIEARHKQTGMGWSNAMTLNLFSFHNSLFEFRLKLRTITINGIEVPCNKSKHDKNDVVWVISTACENWYDWIYGSDCDSNTLYWETEDEIKQVVAALGSAFN